MKFYGVNQLIAFILLEYGGNFGTNGKATTKSYALASAYGEFMERIQNALVKFSKKRLRLLLLSR